MEAESKVIVNWSYDYQIAKRSSDKYNLNKDYVKVLHKRLCSSIGTIVTGFKKATITSTVRLTQTGQAIKCTDTFYPRNVRVHF
jgi:hypothetical protein